MLQLEQPCRRESVTSGREEAGFCLFGFQCACSYLPEIVGVISCFPPNAILGFLTGSPTDGSSVALDLVFSLTCFAWGTCFRIVNLHDLVVLFFQTCT